MIWMEQSTEESRAEGTGQSRAERSRAEGGQSRASRSVSSGVVAFVAFWVLCCCRRRSVCGSCAVATCAAFAAI